MMPGVRRCQNTPISAVLQLEGSWAAEWSAPGLRLSAPLRLCPSEIESVQVYEVIKKIVQKRTLLYLVRIMHLYFPNGLFNPVMRLFNLLLGTTTLKSSPFCPFCPSTSRGKRKAFYGNSKEVCSTQTDLCSILSVITEKCLSWLQKNVLLLWCWLNILVLMLQNT